MQGSSLRSALVRRHIDTPPRHSVTTFLKVPGFHEQAVKHVPQLEAVACFPPLTRLEARGVDASHSEINIVHAVLRV